MQTYEKIELFKNVYFEDSYVTSIEADEAGVTFRLELVLTQGHAQYRPPHENEQYCYANAALILEKASSVVWKKISMSGSTDKNGRIDFGNIDSFRCVSNAFFLEGDWGEVVVSDAQLKLIF